MYRNLLISDQVKKIYVLDSQSKNFKKNKKVSFFLDSKFFFNNKDIDAFIISTPTSTHYKYIKKCLSLDKFVCITKPITNNLEQLLSLKKSFKNINKIFLDHTYLFHSSINFIEKSVRKKKLGKLVYYDSERISFGKFYKDVDVIDDLAIHDLYILDYILKGQLPNKISVTSHNSFGNKNFLSNITLRYPSGFFANIKVSWFSPIKSRRILLAGDKKIKIYNKGIRYTKERANPWLYRTGSIEVPNILHSESLAVMIEKYIKFSKKKNNNLNQFNHAERVMKVLKLIKKEL